MNDLPEPQQIEVVCGVCNGPLINLGPKYKHVNRIDNLHGAPDPAIKKEHNDG